MCALKAFPACFMTAIFETCVRHFPAYAANLSRQCVKTFERDMPAFNRQYYLNTVNELSGTINKILNFTITFFFCISFW